MEQICRTRKITEALHNLQQYQTMDYVGKSKILKLELSETD